MSKIDFAIVHHANQHLILMIEEGRIVEQGTHEQLLAKSERASSIVFRCPIRPARGEYTMKTP